jgi:hypothetical protein
MINLLTFTFLLLHCTQPERVFLCAFRGAVCMMVVCETRTYMKIRDLERSCRMGYETGKRLLVHRCQHRRLYECECERMCRGSTAPRGSPDSSTREARASSRDGVFRKSMDVRKASRVLQDKILAAFDHQSILLSRWTCPLVAKSF